MAHPWQTRTSSETISAIGLQVQLEVGVRSNWPVLFYGMIKVLS